MMRTTLILNSPPERLKVVCVCVCVRVLKGGREGDMERKVEMKMEIEAVKKEG